MRRLLWLGLGLLAACSQPPLPTIVIYAPTGSEDDLRQRLSGSGFVFEIVSGDVAGLTDSIIGRQDSPTADVLVTTSVIDIWRAADQGALRPLASTATRRVPPELRDPDGAWVALGQQVALIGVMPGAPDVAISTYADLGLPDLSGHLCLTSIDQPRNRVLVSMLIGELGPKPAERIVRQWARNLAAPPFADEGALADALRAGTCHVAIISAHADIDGLVSFAPEPVYRDIQGIGVTRHAEHPEAAALLVEWLLETAAVAEPLNSSGPHIGVAGWLDGEARRLAERAGYR